MDSPAGTTREQTLRGAIGALTGLDLAVLLWFFFAAYCWALSYFGLLSLGAVRLFSVPAFLLAAAFAAAGPFRARPERTSAAAQPEGNGKAYAAAAAAVMIGLLLVQLLSIARLPPTNADSMTYHLPKLGLALQYGSMFLPADLPVTRINAYPWSGELAQLAFFSLLRADFLAKLPQLLAAFGIAALLRGHLGAGQRFTALALLSVPIFVTQMVTTQNDLLFYFLGLYVFIAAKDCAEAPGPLNLARLFAGASLLVSTKISGVPLLGVILLVLAAGRFCGKAGKVRESLGPRRLAKNAGWLAAAAALGALVALPGYLVSKKYYNDYIYQPAEIAGPLEPTAELLARNTAANAAHFARAYVRPSLSSKDAFSHDVGHPGDALLLVAFLGGLAFFFRPGFRKSVVSDRLFQVSAGFLLVFMAVHRPDPWDLRLVMFSFVNIFVIAAHYLSREGAAARKGIAWLLLLGAGAVTAGWGLRIVPESLERPGQAALSLGEWREARPSVAALYASEAFRKSGPKSVRIVGAEGAWLYPYFDLNSPTPNRLYFREGCAGGGCDITVVDNYGRTPELEKDLLKCNTLVGKDEAASIYLRAAGCGAPKNIQAR